MGGADLDALAVLADAHGVEAGYWDVAGARHDAGPDALVAVLGALGVALDGPAGAADALAAHRHRRAHTALEPVTVARRGSDATALLRLPPGDRPSGRIEVVVELEHGGSVVLGLVDAEGLAARIDDEAEGWPLLVDVPLATADLPVGYHGLRLVHRGRSDASLLMVAPTTVVGFEPGERGWGVFAPVHALRSADPLGPSLADLDRLGAAFADRGASVVGTLPLLATWLDSPFDPSPYAPISRLAWSELHLDLGRLPEIEARPHVQAWLASPEVQEAFDRLRALPTYDPAAYHQWRTRAVEVAATGLEPTELVGVEGHDPLVADYAAFRAAAAGFGGGWPSWPEPARAGTLGPDDADPVVARFHEYAQHALRRQLRDLTASLAGRGQRLYLDLPVGSHPDGYDTWRHRDQFAWGCSAGAPPDDFFAGGQDWGFPPLHPAGSRAAGHGMLRAVLRHHLAVAGVLRVDHVMGLHRMFFVPAGGDARHGAYVRYPTDELFAVLAIESHRSGCVVVGEDLGTVPDAVRATMAAHEVPGMYVAEFAVPEWAGAEPAAPGPRQVAFVDTHDTPPFAAWVQGLDVERRGGGDAERGTRRQQLANLEGFLRARGHLSGQATEGSLLAALLGFLGSGPSPLVLVDVADLLGETEPQNVPGTPVTRPNWVHRLPVAVEDLGDDPRVAAALASLVAERR